MKTLVETHLEQICKKRVDTIVKKLKDNNYSRYKDKEYTLDFLELLFSSHSLFYGPKKPRAYLKKWNKLHLKNTIRRK